MSVEGLLVSAVVVVSFAFVFACALIGVTL